MKLWLKILCWFLFSSLVFLVIRAAKKEESDTEIAYPEVFIDVNEVFNCLTNLFLILIILVNSSWGGHVINEFNSS